MKKENKILIAVGSALGLIAIYMYLKKSKTTNTSAVSVTNDAVIKSASVSNTSKTSTASTFFDKIFNVGTAVAKSAPSSSPTTTTSSTSSGSSSYNPIVIGGTPPTNPKEPQSSTDYSVQSLPGLSMKDTTLENQAAGLGSLTTAGKDYTNIDNPTGYVDLNAYPDTIVILPQAEGEYTTIPNIEAPSTPDTLPTDIPSWAQQGPDPVLDSANVNNSNDYASNDFIDSFDTGGDNTGGGSDGRPCDPTGMGYGGAPSC
jgi:hypothetical protein